MCDLWKNTTVDAVPVGSIPNQLKHALEILPAAKHIKLYNAANFFDTNSIPSQDYDSILEIVRPFQSVIIENHPKLCGPRCFSFAERIKSNGQRFEVAMGLECIHPDVLPRLNKQMTLDDFRRAADRLVADEIRVRAFILLRPPFLSEQEGVEWAMKSIEFAFAAGVECCSIIPTRFGNGALEQLSAEGWFQPPTMSSMETVIAQGLALHGGRVFMDTWDARQFTECNECADARINRINKMNQTQSILEPVNCKACDQST
jgi:archaeosine synthase beta-subunit